MPEAAEKNLRAQARKKGFTGEQFKKYVYGGLRNIGWKPSRERSASANKVRLHRKRG